jgi:hypothetical protein
MDAAEEEAVDAVITNEMLVPRARKITNMMMRESKKTTTLGVTEVAGMDVASAEEPMEGVAADSLGH